ncbi:MAG TPA: tRNA pseudouridine(38-40) synthase TruA, partial [Desulfurivibrionaceae bacterium]|nr:tRNA pseudouridine(38-40) synthase TruA [Desulfurivibrionaceae bacterium]
MPRRNLRLLLAYDGTAYAGWQRQKGAATVQGVLEEKLAAMTGQAVTLHGAGRTDAGVHALGMVANFHTESTIPAEGLRRGLNGMLADDIRVLAVEEAGPEFHARFSAIGKAYCYFFTFEETVLPTERLYLARFPGPGDWGRMDACMPYLLGEHDFSSFEATGSRDPGQEGGRGVVRRIDVATLTRDAANGRRGKLHLAGNGFLRHMVRNIVGTLVEVGQGRRTPEEFGELISARDRTLAGPTAPPHGLFL